MALRDSSLSGEHALDGWYQEDKGDATEEDQD
jgi:hypothetical protein